MKYVHRYTLYRHFGLLVSKVAGCLGCMIGQSLQRSSPTLVAHMLLCSPMRRKLFTTSPEFAETRGTSTAHSTCPFWWALIMIALFLAVHLSTLLLHDSSSLGAVFTWHYEINATLGENNSFSWSLHHHHLYSPARSTFPNGPCNQD